MADIVAVGEMLVDLTQKVSETGEITYTQMQAVHRLMSQLWRQSSEFPQASSEKSERICSDAISKMFSKKTT